MIEFILLCIILLLQGLSLYAAHRNKDAWELVRTAFERRKNPDSPM